MVIVGGLPVGYVFNPNDKHLLQFFMPLIQQGQPIPGDFIQHADVYGEHPETLTARFHPANASPEWFFFTKSKKKGNNSSRPARSAGAGVWKSTQATKQVEDDDGVFLGNKQSFAYYDKLPNSGRKQQESKSEWLMTEYSLGRKNEKLSCEWVICKIYLTPSARGGRHNIVTAPSENTTTAPMLLHQSTNICSATTSMQQHQDVQNDDLPTTSSAAHALQHHHQYYSDDDDILPDMEIDVDELLAFLENV